tara:strand:- start:79 stop:822 length:744 start_codon:yes stop_codon:yes gene_type:complete
MFKKIKNLSIKSGNIKRYLLYALGEIILVVIGILIALQVNNRNLTAQKQDQEIKLLREVNEAFKSDTLNLMYFSQRIQFNTEKVAALIEVLEADKPYHDSLDHYFAMVVTPFMWGESNSAYKTLLSKGVDIISNDTIRNAIISIHTSLFETLKYLDNGVYIKYPYIHEYCLKHFDRVGSEQINADGQFSVGRMKPNNYERLKSDPEYLSILRTVKSQQEIFLTIIKSTQAQVKLTIASIENEIERRK